MNNNKTKIYYVNRFFKLLDDLIYISIYSLISLIYKDKKKYKDSWIICERGTEAKDNGYKLFKYLRENYKEQKVYYIIDKTYLNDYKRVEKLGNIIQYGSFEHKMAFLISNRLISTHIGTICPWSYRLYKKLFDLRNKKKFIRLGHGIIKDDLSINLNKNTTKIDLFITSSDRERYEVINRYGYSEEEVVCTGLARFDDLYEHKSKKYILFMPTWRRNIAKAKIFNPAIDEEKLFLESQYYKTMKSILNNKNLKSILEEYNYKLIFYPHYEMQKYLKYFDNDLLIDIADKDYNDVQDLLKESKLLITDYSSVFFDFAYMMKPIIYYQFDRDDFFSNHYKKGYFDYIKDGFGDVIECEDELICKILYYIKNNFEVEERYKNNVGKFFKYRDKSNCNRIINAIKQL